ncbi:hypothetical protein L5515_017315 [Caenorhabditis briggsae]|uniref:One cut domain family member n=1 Tax=Caenorhabditis briggsae TaxID=6238 RepID=A0AAE9F887_CAEBR|nr:hypothetical protein L5515_017315 [Caenorhabditis briggsae]
MGMHGKYVDYLQVDPSNTYINKYGPPQEELPDDFLDFPDSPKESSPESSTKTTPTSDVLDFSSWEPVDSDSSFHMNIVYESEAETDLPTHGVLSSMTINQQFYVKKTKIEKNLIAEERCFGDSHLNIDGSSDLENAIQNGNVSQQDMVNFGGKSIIQHQQIDVEVVEQGNSVRIPPNYDDQENQLDSMKTLSKQKPKRVKKSRQAPQKDLHDSEVEEEIDTKDVAMRIVNELKTHHIPQKTFAERILCRSQGTLSDLLRKPKPWNMLKSGQETFRRMHKWLQQPLTARLSILDMSTEEAAEAQGLLPPTPVPSGARKRRMNSDESDPAAKVARFVFTTHQKQTLQSVYKITQRPTREMHQKLADYLEISIETVENFFMNARRRDRHRQATTQVETINGPITHQQEAEILSEYESDDNFY